MRRRRCRRLGVLLAVFAPVVACGDLGGLAEERLIGAIEWYDEPVEIVAPDTVAAGASFEVRVRTYGDGCSRQDNTEVRDLPGGALVIPYDIRSYASACEDVLKTFDHRATLTIPDAGTATIQFIGRAEPAGTTVNLEREVVVE